MAQTGFQLQCWSRASTSANEPNQSNSGIVSGCFREYNYYSPVDSQATCAASGYFNNVAYDLVTGDLVRVYSLTENTYVVYQATVSSSEVVTLAVVNTGVSGGINFAQVSLTNAQILGMYAAPVLLVPAPLATQLLVVNKFSLNLVFNTAAFAGGGVVAPQYSSTVDGGGQNTCSATISAATLTGVSANEIISLTGIVAATVTNSTGVSGLGLGQGIYLSNASAPFTNAAGGASTAIASIWYSTIAAS